MRKSKEELARGNKLTIWQSSLSKALEGLNIAQRGVLLNCVYEYLCGSPYSSSNEVVNEHFRVLLEDFEMEKNKEADKSKKRSLAGTFSHTKKNDVPNGTNNVPNGTKGNVSMYQMVQSQPPFNVPNGTKNKASKCVESLFEDSLMYQMVQEEEVFKGSKMYQMVQNDVPNGTKGDLNNILNNNLNNNILTSKKDKKENKIKERNESENQPNVPNGTTMAEIPIGGHGVVNGKQVYKRRSGLVFIAPTAEEVSQYIEQKGYHFDAKCFIDYYEADDWHYGEDRTPVKSWKRCCSTFEQNCIRKAGKIAMAQQSKNTINAHENIKSKNYETF